MLWHRSKGGTKPSRTGHRRAAPPRQLARRDRDCPRPRDRQGHVAGADGRRRRVLAGRRRRHRLLRSDGRTPVRGQLRTGRIRWAYDTGAKITASPSVWSASASRTTRARSASPRPDVRTRALDDVRQARHLRWESFYASPSTDGERIYCVARSGRVVALDASDGSTAWTSRVGGLGYTTPAIANGRVFVGGFDGRLRAYRATNGAELWTVVRRREDPRRAVRRRAVFFSTLDKRTSRCARRTARSHGGSRWAATRRESRPSARTTSR